MCSRRRFWVRYRVARVMFRLPGPVTRMLRGSRRRSSLNREIKKRLVLIAAVSALAGAAAFVFGQSPSAPYGQSPAAPPLRFAILGIVRGKPSRVFIKRSGSELAAAKPAFVVGVGDSIRGTEHDATAESEWISF